MEASSKSDVGGAPEKPSSGSEAVGAQLVAEALKQQVSRIYLYNNERRDSEPSQSVLKWLRMFDCFRVLNTCLV